MTKTDRSGARLFWILGASLVAVKLWLVAGQTMTAYGASPHDDRLFLRLAGHLLQGEWLGPYSDKTLAKGPFFSMFVALVFLTGLPLFAAVHLCYATACAAVTRALRPILPGAWFALGLFALLLFNPVTFDTGEHMRAWRQIMTPFQSLFIVAGLAGIATRLDAGPRRVLPWALLTGASLGFFWITREESVWITPAVACIGAWTAFFLWKQKGEKNIRPLALTLLAVPVLWAAPSLIVSAINLRYYGLFTTCEFKRSEFKAAYGALTRVKPATWQPFIPVARETRERIYAVSPEFARLQPLLEGRLSDNWASNASRLGIPLGEREISGAHFMWALRDAVNDTGLAPDGAAAMACYTRLAEEVNAACDNGRLDSWPKRATMLPPFVAERIPLIRASVAEALSCATTFSRMSATPIPSNGSPELRALFEDLTRTRLAPAKTDAPGLLIAQPIMDRVRVRVLGGILAAYQAVVPWSAGAAAVVWIFAVADALRKRRIPFLLPFGAGLAIAALATVLIAALVNATSFPAIRPGYMGGFYGIYLLLIGLAWPMLRSTLRRDLP